jgi:hypothetical protein
MPTHTCKRCLFCAKQKCTLRIHLSRKNVCEVNAEKGGQDIPQATLLEELGEIRQRNPEHMCDLCGNGFASKPGLCRHRKQCSSRSQFDTLNRKVDTLIKIVTKSEDKKAAINLVPYGEEDTSFLTKEFLTMCVRDLKGDGILKIIQEIYFNKDYPQYHNVRASSIKQQLLEVYDGVTWNAIPTLWVMDNLIKKARSLAFGIFNTMTNLTDDEQMAFQESFNELGEDFMKRSSSIKSRIHKVLFSFFAKAKSYKSTPLPIL